MKYILLFILISLSSCKKKYNHYAELTSKDKATLRIMTNNAYWDKWMPGKKINDNTYQIDDYKITVAKAMFTNLQVSISNGKTTTTGSFNFGYDANNKQYVQWIPTSSAHNATNKIAETIVQNIATTLNSTEKIYGFEPKLERTKDANLLVKKTILNHYPTHDEIYKIIDELTLHAKNQNATIQNNPLLNIHTEDSTQYQLMIAIATQNESKGGNGIDYKRLVDGNILVATITGDQQTILKSQKELKNYLDDYQSVSPAIPFQELVTHRINEKDSSKWITKLYYPVFY